MSEVVNCLCIGVDQTKPTDFCLPGAPSLSPLSMIPVLGLCMASLFKRHPDVGHCTAGGITALPAAAQGCHEAFFSGSRLSAMLPALHHAALHATIHGSKAVFALPPHSWTLTSPFPQSKAFTSSSAWMVLICAGTFGNCSPKQHVLLLTLATVHLLWQQQGQPEKQMTSRQFTHLISLRLSSLYSHTLSS